jgi:hypothetical protein
VEKFTPNRKENLEPVKFKDEKGKVVLSKTLQAFIFLRPASGLISLILI